MKITRREAGKNSLTAIGAVGGALMLGRFGLGSLADAKPAPVHHFACVHTDAEWKKILTPAQYTVLRQAGTDPPFSRQYEGEGERHLQMRRLRQ